MRKVTSGGTVSTLAGSAGNSGSTDATGTSARFAGPVDVAWERATGNLYVADELNHTIRKITPAGAVSTFAGSAGVRGSANGTGSAANFDLPGGVAVDASGNVFVADTLNQTVRKITSARVVTTIGGTVDVTGSADGIGTAALFNSPYRLAVRPDGSLVLSDSFNNRITSGVTGPEIALEQPTGTNLTNGAALSIDSAP